MVTALKGWHWPIRNAKSELRSLVFQAERFKVGVKPHDEELKRVTKRMLQEYPHVPPLPIYSRHEGEVKLSRGAFDMLYPSMLNDVKKESSPGMPFMVLGCADNGNVLDKYPEQLKSAVWERLMLLSFNEYENLNAVQLVESGAVDPVRIFVKNEPHPELKVKQGRMRLISSVSLIDQIVERILLSQQNKEEIDSWSSIPSKPGLGLNDEGLAKLWRTVRSWDGNIFEADISGWDFGLQAWEMLWESDTRAELAGMAGTIYHRAIRNRTWCEANSLFVLSDGRLIAQTVPGKRCSGSYNTSAGNSRCRVMLGYLVGSEQIMAMGDDSVEVGVAEAAGKYEEMGHIIKTFSESKDAFEFCSTKIYEKNGTVIGEPVNWSRTFYRLLWATDGFDVRLNQFKFEMRHSPYLQPCINLLLRIGWGSSNHVEEAAAKAAESSGEK
jgi:hypothetical protein